MPREYRRLAYRFGAFLGDLSAILSGKPGKVIKRAANKFIGKNIVSKLWIK